MTDRRAILMRAALLCVIVLAIPMLGATQERRIVLPPTHIEQQRVVQELQKLPVPSLTLPPSVMPRVAVPTPAPTTTLQPPPIKPAPPGVPYPEAGLLYINSPEYKAYLDAVIRETARQHLPPRKQ